MNETTLRFLYWAPRVLGILLAVFVSVFALDVFGEGYGFWSTVLALVMHLIPTALIVLALVIGWRWEWIGGILFIALGVFYVFMTGGSFGWLTSALTLSSPVASELFARMLA